MNGKKFSVAAQYSLIQIVTRTLRVLATRWLRLSEELCELNAALGNADGSHGAVAARAPPRMNIMPNGAELNRLADVTPGR